MVSIARISTNDLESLADLYKELLYVEANLEKMKNTFQWIDSNDNYILLGARDGNNNLVGSILGIICQDIIGGCRPFMVIENVIVKSNFRNLGVGKILIQYLENYALKRNCSYTMLVSSSYRKESHKFYQAVGYDIDAVQGFKKYL
ncbi:GNAT family N-acetyltransferase [Clostridium sp. SHJSY1]|uniref:GNAT family N-acetyltransferase n=1 Tax=Clostridium sp. SHJSY1 TaxID=2942483 RepID=UPI0028741AE7|nr:GNAT family N-acetyltransferase [Clostridium sp. SHJSY1]MDS0526909.1 GNAT family N-acetyltransferase [Clostridium sp. SHJSY1]